MTASANLDDGYTRIANTLLDAILAFDFTKRQQTVLIAIIRKTYGYNKSEDDIGLSQLADLTGMHKPHVSKAIAELEAMKVITRRSGGFGHVLKVNKKYTEWMPESSEEKADGAVKGVTKTVTVTETATVTKLVTGGLPKRSSRGYQNGQTPVTELVTTKDNHTKDKPTKDKLQKVTAGGLTPTTPTPEQESARRVWSNYSTAYRVRYGTDPIRNAKTNSLIAQFVRRVPLDEAEFIAGYYLTLSKGWYVSKGHDLGSMLNDAEALRTQWVTGRRTTDTQARQADQTQANGQVFLDLIASTQQGALRA